VIDPAADPTTEAIVASNDEREKLRAEVARLERALVAAYTDVEVLKADRDRLAQLGDEVPMPPATHVLWGGHVLCEDKRLRGVPRDWPSGQRWISLKDVADGTDAPPDRCEACWTKAPELVAGLRQIGST